MWRASGAMNANASSIAGAGIMSMATRNHRRAMNRV